MVPQLKIEPLLLSELPLIRPLQPPAWNDIMKVFAQHLEQDYFYALKILRENQIVAIGQAILNTETAWLGNIIVHPAFFRQGLGRRITEYLINYLQEQGRSLIFLLATKEGAPLYERMGFKPISEYLFLKGALKFPPFPSDPNIQNCQAHHGKAIFALDRLAMGEDRMPILQRHLKAAWVYISPSSEQLIGFFIPTLGDGLIIAQNSVAGVALMKKRFTMNRSFIVVPEESEAALAFAKSLNFYVFRKAKLMVLGADHDINRNLQMVYNRIAGNIG